METIACIQTRTSTRKFRPEALPRETLEAILDAARHSPSYRNCQAWEVVVVSGKKKESLSGYLVQLVEEGTGFSPDIPPPVRWPEAMQKMMETYFAKRANFLKIKMDDPGYAKKLLVENFRFYGAPHVLFLFQDASLSNWQILDIGMFAQTLMLAAHAMGVGTVPQAFLTNYADQVKNFLNIPGSKRLVLGISTGYPDPGDQASSFRSERKTLSEFVKWVE